MIALRKHEFREDFEVIDEAHICRGFIWKYADTWAVRIDTRAGVCKLPTPLCKTPWRGMRRFCCGHG